jgi:hypothetical protein
LKAQEDYLNKRIKDKIPQGSYSVQSYIPAGGEGKAFLYLVDKIDENKGTFYLPKNSITELGNKSLEEIVETVKNSSKLLKETDYSKINVVPLKLKGEIVGYLIHTDEFSPNSWQKKGNYLVNPNMKSSQDSGGSGGGAGGGGHGGK